MSETLVPEAWAEAFSCWCQNVFLRACGQTKIKGNRAAEWHHTHMHAYTRLNGLSQFGFIMSQLFNVSNPHNAVWLNKQHTLPSSSEVGSEWRKRGEVREVKKALATPLHSFYWCQGHRRGFPSRSHLFFSFFHNPFGAVCLYFHLSFPLFHIFVISLFFYFSLPVTSPVSCLYKQLKRVRRFKPCQQSSEKSA